jgi:GT2 family glycosyltransferase
MEKSVCLSIISGGSMKTDTVSCLLDSVAHLPAHINLILPVGGYPVENRTKAVDLAIKAKNTHIMFIDGDMIFPPDGVARLLSQDKEIIGGNYNLRRLPLVSTVKLANKNGKFISGSSKDFPKETFKVAAVATGFCLIDLSVFKKIPKPWFRADFIDGEFMTEDVFFCLQAKKAGYDIWCDPTLDILHLGDYKY